MTVSVTMTVTRMGEDGTYWEAGTVHNATETFAKHLVQHQWATASFNDATGFTLPKGRVTASGAFELLDHQNNVVLTSEQFARLTRRAKRIRSTLGPEAFDLVAISALPAGVSFSGAGSYASAGILAVQSTGTVTHNATGWFDGTECLDFVPNASAAELRIFNAAGLNISDENGIAFEFGIPEDLDTSTSNFSINFIFSSDATNLFPTNQGGVRMWVCTQTTAQSKEKGGRKYIRQLWDATADTDEACGAWSGYANVYTAAGTGADRTALCKYVKFAVNNFSGKTIKFKSIRRGGRSTPCLVVGSDAAGPSELFSAMAYMAAKGMPGYLAQYISSLTGATLEAYRAAYAAGHEITGDDLVDRALGSTVTDEPTMRAAIEGTRNQLTALGLGASRVWVANNNSTSYMMIRELERAGYVANRNGETDGRYVFPEGGVNDPYRLPAATFDNLNFDEIQPIVDRTISYGCTLWVYWHGVLSSDRIDADRTANVTGTSGAPIERSGTESLAEYRARAAALGTAAGNASVVYFDARIGATALGIWWEELKQFIDYIAPLNLDGSCVVVTPEQWCADVGLT